MAAELEDKLRRQEKLAALRKEREERERREEEDRKAKRAQEEEQQRLRREAEERVSCSGTRERKANEERKKEWAYVSL